MGMDRPLKKKRFPLKWLFSVGALIIALITFTYQVHYADKSPVIYVKKENMRFVEARQDRFQEYINIIGRVVSSRTSYIDTLETGTVKELLVEEGDLLSEGQTVLVLENNQLETSLRLKQSQIKEKELALRMEQLICDQKELAMREELLDIDHKLNDLDKKYKRSKKLYNSSRAISKSEFEKIEDACNYWHKKREMLKAHHQLKQRSMAQQLNYYKIGLNILRTEKKRLEVRITNLIIKVATAGLLTKLEASVGEIKPAGSRIAQFDVIHPLKVEAEIDEYYLNRVNINYEGRFDIEQAQGETQTGYAVITMIHPEVKNNVFTAELRFKDTQTKGFKIGQTFDIKLALGKPQEAIVIKKGPFIQDTGGNWVYVVDPSKAKAFKRRIKVGRQNPEYLEVLEGLHPGEVIIITRYDTYDNLAEITIN
jgi:HlyD family secretion protein